MRLMLIGLLLLLALSASAQPLSGTLTIGGSDTLAMVMARAAEGFRAANPGVHIQLQTLGSASAATALLEGAIDIGAMSRSLNPGETAAFATRQRPLPLQVAIARDALAIVVHRDNPLRQLSMQQVDAIYADQPGCGGRSLTRWSQLLGDQPAWAARSILPIGRNAASGSHLFFQQAMLCSNRFRANVVEWPGNGAVIRAVAHNREAIGYASISSVDATVRLITLTDNQGVTLSMDPASLRDGRYPLARELSVVANRDAQGRLRPLTAAFMHHLISDESQAGLRRLGFQPLLADEREAASSALH